MRSITQSIAGNWPYMALWFGVLIILMAAVCLLMKFEPYTAGSGIPQTKANCGVAMYNRCRSWCIRSGGPCICCCEADPHNPKDKIVSP